MLSEYVILQDAQPCRNRGLLLSSTSSEKSLLLQAAFLTSLVLKPSLNALGASPLASVPSVPLTDFFAFPVTLIIIVRHLLYNSFVALSWRNSDNLS